MEWRLGALALGVLAVVACAAGPTGSTAHSPTPFKSPPSPSASPSPVPTIEPSPTPLFPSPTPAAAVLKCRIPISNGQPGSGGFVVFPGGKFVADPASNVVITGIPTPSPGPYGYYQGNFFGLTYDRRYSKWLPVLRNMVTPDETRYVYALSDGVYVRNVSDGTTAQLGAGAGRAWTVYDVEDEGVYANPVSTSQQAVAGLWLLPFSGDARQVTTKGYWQMAGHGFAYGFMAPSVPSGATQSLLRLDLKTGAINPWYTDLGQNANLVGLDSQGRLIVLVQTFGQQLLLLSGSNQAITIFDGSATNSNIYISSTIADSNGLWLATGDGLYLSRDNGTPEKVSDVSGPIGGPCV